MNAVQETASFEGVILPPLRFFCTTHSISENKQGRLPKELPQTISLEN